MAHARRTTVWIALPAPLTPAELPRLSERLDRLLERSAPEVIVCDARAANVDAVTVEALARVALGARRHGDRLVVHGVSPVLADLLRMMGLAEVLGARR